MGTIVELETVICEPMKLEVVPAAAVPLAMVVTAVAVAEEPSGPVAVKGIEAEALVNGRAVLWGLKIWTVAVEISVTVRVTPVKVPRSVLNFWRESMSENGTSAWPTVVVVNVTVAARAVPAAQASSKAGIRNLLIIEYLR
jgi:hypothetical protein